MAKRKPARKKGKGGGLDRWIVAGIVLSLAVIALTLWGPLRKYLPATPQKQRVDAGRQDKALPGKTALVAIVVDDLGGDLKQAGEVLSLPGRVTVAVMPGLAQSKMVAELAKKNNREVLIHLPMEARGSNGSPAPGLLRSDMTPMEFLNTVSDDVASVPGAFGINNHEGSALTENKEAMKFLMAELKARDLMFLDSVTTPNTVAYATAREFGLKSARRDVFLDNDFDNPASIRKQLGVLVELAHKNGKAVGIGHPHPATLAELRKWLTEAASQGVEVVPVSRLMH